MRDYVILNGKSHVSEHVFWGGLKEFSDGTIGALTALMHEPYKSDNTTRGIQLIDFDDLAAAVAGAEASCLQVGPRHLACRLWCTLDLCYARLVCQDNILHVDTPY